MAKKFVSKENLSSAWAKKIKPEIDKKISSPTGGKTGDFLKKTEDGVAWAEIEFPEITVDKALDANSTNPVENKAVKAAIDSVNNSLGDYAKSADVAEQIANAKSEIIGGAGQDYDTLKEIETWVVEHQDLYAGLVTSVGLKATTEYVNSQLELKADKTDVEGVKTNLSTNYYTSTQVEGKLKEITASIDEITAYEEDEILAIFS